MNRNRLVVATAAHHVTGNGPPVANPGTGTGTAMKVRQKGWPWGARWAHPDHQHFSASDG